MKKSLLFRLFALVAAFSCALGANAYSFAKNGIYYNITGSGTVEVTYRTYPGGSYSGRVNIPSTVVNGSTTYTVTAIGDNAFEDSEGLTRVSIPNTVTRIGDGAFVMCVNLTTVTIPASVTNIGGVAFGNSGLETIYCLAYTPPVPGDGTYNTESDPFYPNLYENATLYVLKGRKSAYQNAVWWSEFDNIQELGYSFVYDDIYYNITSSNAVEVTCHDIEVGGDYSEDIVIPSSVPFGGKNYRVTGIGEGAFINCSDLGEVTLPNTITTIGTNAFCNSSLSSINIPNSVTSIHFGAFWHTGLRSVEIPSSVASIAGYAFMATLLNEIICHYTNPPGFLGTAFDPISYSDATVLVPRGYKSIYQNTTGWENFENITEVSHDFVVNGIYYLITGSSTVEVVDKWHGYSGSVNIPSNVSYGGKTYTVTGINEYAFYNSFDLISVTIPSTVTTIGDFAFYNCFNLASVNIPNSVTHIGYVAFASCTSLTSISIPNSVTIISSDMFSGCTALTSVTIPNSVTTIEGQAFKDCSSLTSVTLGSSVSSIQDRAFLGCTQLSQVKCKATTPPSMAARTVFDDATYNSQTFFSTLIVPEGTKSAYESADWWKEFDLIMEDTYDFVVNGYYYNITGSNTVELAPKTAVGSTYSGDVVVPSTVTYGGKTYTVTGIAGSCFAWSTLASLTLPNTITAIGPSAFAMCSGLSTINLPSSMTEIGESAFSFCLGLTNMTIPNSVTYIGPQAFSWCAYMTSVTLPSDLTYIGNNAFAHCSGLTSVVIPNKVTRINYETFNYCSGLTSVTLGNAVTFISFDAFAHCTSLTSITIPYATTSISGDAFLDCTALTTINCMAPTPPSIMASTFTSDHYSTVTLKVPRSTKGAYQAADHWKNFATIQERVYDFAKDNIYYLMTGVNTVDVTYKDNNYNSYSGSVSVPSSVTYGIDSFNVTAIGTGAFEKSNGLTSVSIPNSVTEIKEDAFYQCSHMTNMTIPNSVTTIGRWAFDGCSALQSIILPNGLRRISDYVFFACTSLKEIFIPSTVTEIGYRAFYNCYALENVTIPASVTNIGSGAFNSCTALKGVTCLAATPPTVGDIGVFTNSTYNSAKLFVPKTSMADYKSAPCWKLFNQTQPTLDYALNTDGGTIEFASTGDYPWINVVEGDRVYAVSSNKGYHSTTSSMSATVTLQRDGVVTFDFKAWGEGSNYDVCAFTVDYERQFSYGARKNAWETYSIELEAGTHILSWDYIKDYSVHAEGDYFAVDNVSVTVNVASGDVDGDGRLTIGDVSELIDMLLGGTATVESCPAADVDGDGRITIGDVSELIDALLRG